MVLISAISYRWIAGISSDSSYCWCVGGTLLIDGFHGSVIKLQSRNSEVLRILIYTRLKINKKKSLYKFLDLKDVSFRKQSNLNFLVFTVRA